MFYNNTLMNSPGLSGAWRAGNQIIDKQEADLPKICDCLGRWLDSTQDRSGGLSLRASSILINGAARLYKKEVDILLKECWELEMEMALRGTRGTKFETAECWELEMGMALRGTRGRKFETAGETNISGVLNNDDCSETRSGDSSSSIRKRQSQSKSSQTENRKRSRNTNETIQASDKEDEDDAGGNSTVFVNFSNQEHQESSPRVETRKEGTQTNKSHLNRHQKGKSIQLITCNQTHFDKDLPFGHVMIYNSYQDRLPSKIIFSSLNARVKEI